MRAVIKQGLSTPLGWRLTAPLRRRGAAVLMYHRVGPPDDPFPGLAIDVFRRQAEWLRRHCDVVAPEDLPDAIHRARRVRPPVLLTFDDGYRSFHDHVYPVLKGLDMPALVFLPTAYLDDPALLFEWDTLWLAVQKTRRSRVTLPWSPGDTLEIGGPAARTRLFRAARAGLKEKRQPERDAATRRLLEALEVGREDLRVDRQVMSWAEADATRDLVRYGGHSHTHPIMTHLAPEEIEEEVRLCRNRMEAELGEAPRYFAYPSGRAGDFGPETIQTLRRHGFDTAFSTIEGLAGGDTDWMAVRRLPAVPSVAGLAWTVAALTVD